MPNPQLISKRDEHTESCIELFSFFTLMVPLYLIGGYMASRSICLSSSTNLDGFDSTPFVADSDPGFLDKNTGKFVLASDRQTCLEYGSTFPLEEKIPQALGLYLKILAGVLTVLFLYYAIAASTRATINYFAGNNNQRHGDNARGRGSNWYGLFNRPQTADEPPQPLQANDETLRR